MGKHRVTYGGRAFQQDAMNAMKGDIVRGLIELITNCDDAYGDDRNGKISVEVEHRRRSPWKVVVRDRARGMRADRMRVAIGGLAERTSGFESGKNVRGNLGRGAKDVAAFGPVTFESICDGYYTKMVLEEDGSYDDLIERKAREKDREQLGIRRGSGTVVSVLVGEKFKCPLHRTLLQRLSSHYQLRDINSDPRRELTLIDLGSGGTDGIRYGRPSLTEMAEVDLSIPGYEDASATLTLYRNAERYENPATDTSRPEGILLKGRRAIYENTLFSSEGNPYAHWFSGTLRCDYIDDLARGYDQHAQAGNAADPANPVPIISRSRDGLEHEHPFYKALAEAADEALRPFVDAEAESARSGAAEESTRMRRTLDSLGRDLGRMIDADLREIDEDGLGGGEGGNQDEPIRVIPQSPVLYMNENKTISVVVRRDVGESEIVVEPDPEGVVELLDGFRIPLTDHPRRDDLLIARVRLRPLVEDEETYLTVRCAEHETVALAEVRPEREDPEPSPPETLQFDREKYQMSVGKRRSIRLLAPMDVVNDYGQNASLMSDSSDIVVLGGKAELEFDEDLLCWVAEVEVDPRSLGAKASITARLGELTATCDVVVAQNQGGGPNIQIRIADEVMGKYRAEVTREGETTVIKILGGHPAIRRYLGPGPRFPFQDRLGTRVVIAEIVAGEATRMVMEKKYAAAGELDGPAFYHEHMTYMEKYLSRCHKEMIADNEIT